MNNKIFSSTLTGNIYVEDLKDISQITKMADGVKLQIQKDNLLTLFEERVNKRGFMVNPKTLVNMVETLSTSIEPIETWYFTSKNLFKTQKIEIEIL